MGVADRRRGVGDEVDDADADAGSVRGRALAIGAETGGLVGGDRGRHLAAPRLVEDRDPRQLWSLPPASRPSAAGTSRLSCSEPWLPPRTSRCTSPAAVCAAGRAAKSARTGTPVTVAVQRRLLHADSKATAASAAQCDSQRLARPARALGSTRSAGTPASEAPSTAGADT